MCTPSTKPQRLLSPDTPRRLATAAWGFTILKLLDLLNVQDVNITNSGEHTFGLYQDPIVLLEALS